MDIRRNANHSPRPWVVTWRDPNSGQQRKASFGTYNDAETFIYILAGQVPIDDLIGQLRALTRLAYGKRRTIA